MKRLCRAALSIAVVFGAFALCASAWAGPGPEQSFTPGQKSAVEAIVRDYLQRHPEVMIDALRAYQQRQQSAQEEESRSLLKANRPALNQDDGSFAAGPEKAPVTVVEFFDYRCGFCKQMMPSVMKLIADRPDVRVVLKEFPVLGPESLVASRAALAALHQDPGKYLAFHRAMLGEHGTLTDARIFALAQQVGLDVPKLREAMDDRRIKTILDANHKLAERLRIEGTPTFVIGDAMVPGAVEYASLVELVDEAAKSCTTC